VKGRLIIAETAEKEVQDTSCRGSGGTPQLKKSPKIGGLRGLIETISAISYSSVSHIYLNEIEEDILALFSQHPDDLRDDVAGEVPPASSTQDDDEPAVAEPVGSQFYLPRKQHV
jgi:hypothetical protein